MVEDVDWRAIINAMPIDLNEEGLVLTEDIPIEKKRAQVYKFSFDIHLISMLESPYKHFMITSKQTMEDLGEMTVEDATKKIKRMQKRRKAGDADE